MPVKECAYGCGKPFTYRNAGIQTAKGHKECYNSQRRSGTADLLTPVGGYAESIRAPKRSYPTGWEPRVEVDGDEGTLVSTVTENADPERDALLKGSDLDPKEWEIVGDLAFNKWQGMVPVEEDSSDCKCAERQTVKHHEMRWQFQYKARLRRFNAQRSSEIAALCEEIRTHIPIPFAPPKGDDALVIAIADLQMGKGDQGGSPRATGNFLRSVDAFEERIPLLRAQGKAHGTLYIMGMGDLIENCSDFYAQQTYRVDNNLRDQVKTTRRLILKAIERWAPLFERVVVPVVGGNHGENRRGGKSFTDFGDNHDLAIFEQVEEILDANRATYGHVSFLIPKENPSLTLDMGGEIVGLTHGHVMSGGRSKVKIKQASPVSMRAVDWWAAQAHGGQPIGDARILFNAHFHHFLVTDCGWKTHFQCPALESGSDWFEYQTGASSRKGMLTLRIGKNVSESGWGDLEIV